MRILTVQVNEPRRGGGEQTGVPGEKTPTTNPRIGTTYLSLEVKTHRPKPGIEPSPSNFGDKFAWSERAGSYPLNYWLPPMSHTVAKR